MSSFYHKAASAELRLSNISTNDFRWLLEEGWDDPLCQFFCQQRSKICTVLAHRPVAYHKKASKNKSFAGAWILTAADHTPLCWAELQHFYGALTLVHLLVGPLAKPDFELAPQALSLLISSLFISTPCDGIKVIPLGLGNPWSAVLGAFLPSLTPRPLWSPLKDFATANATPDQEVGRQESSWLISPQEWWQQAGAQKDRETLRYLELRKANQAKKEELEQCQKRRFWQILSRRRQRK